MARNINDSAMIVLEKAAELGYDLQYEDAEKIGNELMDRSEDPAALLSALERAGFKSRGFAMQSDELRPMAI